LAWRTSRIAGQIATHARVDAPDTDSRFSAWIAALEARHLAELTFPEVSRALRALSSAYVERRARLAAGAALSGAGKRAAFALFYGPLHYLLMSHIVRELPGAAEGSPTIIDLGCGTGASGSAWAAACRARPRVVGVDRHPWALGEASATYRSFGVNAQTRQGDIATAPLPKGPASILAAFTVNELPDDSRDQLLQQLLERASQGDRVLIVEPVARFVARWWGGWRQAFEQAGGRADEWRVRADLPAIVKKLDRAAGLDHREITGRSLWIGQTQPRRAGRAGWAGRAGA
jgi:SAM-dependent methyltransferase